VLTHDCRGTPCAAQGSGVALLSSRRVALAAAPRIAPSRLARLRSPAPRISGVQRRAARAAAHSWREDRIDEKQYVDTVLGQRYTSPWMQHQPIWGDYAVQKCALCGQERRRLIRATAHWDDKDTVWNSLVREDDPRKQWTLVGEDTSDECPGEGAAPPAQDA
jgi:hypothetical protein